MPELTAFVWVSSIELIFEVGVAISQFGMKSFLVAEGLEVEREARGEYGDIFGKIAIVGVIQAIYLLLSVTITKLEWGKADPL